MEIDEAVVAARRSVDEMAQPVSMAVDHVAGAIERDWCFVFIVNSVEFVATRDFMVGFLGPGPVIVPKDGSPPVLLGSAETVQAYEAAHRIDGGHEIQHRITVDPRVAEYWRTHGAVRTDEGD